jgi:hypothetical protein
MFLTLTSAWEEWLNPAKPTITYIVTYLLMSTGNTCTIVHMFTYLQSDSSPVFSLLYSW